MRSNEPQQSAYPGPDEVRELIRGLGPTTLFDLFEAYRVPEEDRLGLVEEVLGLLGAEGWSGDDVVDRFLPALDARCRRVADSRPAEGRADPEETGFPLFGRIESLVEASREAVSQDPHRAVELAEVAVELANRIDPRICGDTATVEQRIVAWARLGDARRLSSDLHAAELAFQESLRLAEESRPAILVRGEVLHLLGSLRIDQGRYEEARWALSDALAIYRGSGADPEEREVRRKLADVEARDGLADV